MHSCIYSADRLPLQKVLKHRADFMGTLNETMAPYLFCLTYEQLCMSWWCSPTPLIRLSIFGESIVLVLRIATTPSISIMTALFANVDVLKGLSYYSESTFTINTVIADYLIDFFSSFQKKSKHLSLHLTSGSAHAHAGFPQNGWVLGANALETISSGMRLHTGPVLISFSLQHYFIRLM